MEPPEEALPGQEPLWADPGADGWAPAPPEMLDAAPRRRRWLRRTLLTLTVALVIVGLVGGSLAYLDHRREVQRTKEEAARVAAEKRAAAAYVAAVHPLAVKVFDAVQPIQDVYDRAGHRPPGFPAARDDVLQHGGGLRDLRAVKLSLARLRVPVTYAEEAQKLRLHLDGLISAVADLESSSHEKPNSHNIITSFGPNFEALQTAELEWLDSVGDLADTGTWPVPNEDRSSAHGRKAATAGGFIMASDFACAGSWAVLKYEDFKHPNKALRTTYPKMSRELRKLVVKLQAAPYPTTQRPLRHRLELGWTSTLDVAKQMDAMTAAYKRHQVTAFEKAFDRLETAMDGMNDLALAYKSVGIRECRSFFVVDDDKGSSSASA